MTAETEPPRRNFYGRIRGKTLRASQKTYLAVGLEPLSVKGVTREDNPARVPLDLAAITGGRPLWLEVGFGGGEHLVHMALLALSRLSTASRCCSARSARPI
jgi:tRNA (guanine-N7-)-methyltransferase